MKRKVILSILVLTLGLSFNACKEDEYMDWKIQNDAWIQAHKSTTNITTSETGLQYVITHQGTGRRPGKFSYVVVNYTGKLIDGTVFDSGTNVPMSMESVVAGFREGLMQLNGGGTCTLYIPNELGYGKDGGTSIPPYSVLIFDITLVSSTY